MGSDASGNLVSLSAVDVIATTTVNKRVIRGFVNGIIVVSGCNMLREIQLWDARTG
jgi:hypothetical protein